MAGFSLKEFIEGLLVGILTGFLLCLLIIN